MRSKEPEATPAALEARLRRTRSRGEVKALGDEADANPEIRAAMLVIARRRNLELEPDLDGRRLVRALLGRAECALELGKLDVAARDLRAVGARSERLVRKSTYDTLLSRLEAARKNEGAGKP